MSHKVKATNQAMKFGQLIAHNKRNIFLQKLGAKWGWETSSRPLFNLKKSLIWDERKWSAAWFQHILIALNFPYYKNKLYKMFRLLIQKCAQFPFFRKGSGTSFSTTFYVWSFAKIFLMLHSINWPNFIVWLLLLFEILDNMCIKIVCSPGCNVIRIKINLIFLIQPFPYMTKKSRQEFKYLEKEKSFWDEIKKHFISLLKGFKLPKIISDPRVRL